MAATGAALEVRVTASNRRPTTLSPGDRSGVPDASVAVVRCHRVVDRLPVERIIVPPEVAVKPLSGS
jgi:hypothetical protein